MGSSLTTYSINRSQPIHGYFVPQLDSNAADTASTCVSKHLTLFGTWNALGFPSQRQPGWLVHGWEFRILATAGGTGDGCPPHQACDVACADASIARVAPESSTSGV